MTLTEIEGTSLTAATDVGREFKYFLHTTLIWGHTAGNNIENNHTGQSCKSRC